ncbi:rho GTPase-activating protein 11A isoform X2 [Ambystoma mexicanum]|uniref:rho GTPase-activating protein 11A isoform X2 n=1 Tax=Ambystoma mexicanum TaxID=8296 RepID=UPI0037E8EAB7
MKPLTDHKSLLRLAVVQQLRSHGIKIKHWNSKQRLASEAVKPLGTSDSGKTFGTPLHDLPHTLVQDYGNIPSFVVAACKHLELHASTEGLFRKSGSVVRLKSLKSKLDVGDGCLAAAPPCDVAGLLKQFFRELPEPILRLDLQESFIKAQQLASEEEKTAATLLLSCLMSDHTIDTLRYFFAFLRRVSMKSSENKMDSSNLAVIFAPNLLQSSDGSEKMTASTEKKLRLQVDLVRTLIDRAADIGRVPDLILEKLPAMLGIDADCGTPFLENYEDGEWESPGERKRRQRRSVGVFSSIVTPVILTPSTKRKLPVDSCPGFSNKKRRSLKHNLGFDFLPNSLFSGGFTPASAQSDASPCVSLENSESSLSPFVISTKLLSSSGNRRKKRFESKKMHRVESGKTGCFSPKISRKEMVRRSLRLKFSLGKSSRENLVSAYPSTSSSENIGWRLATQQELEQGSQLSKANASSSPLKSVKRGMKIISKSEENLLTPKCSEGTKHRMSWTGPGQSDQPISEHEGTPLMGYLNPTNVNTESVLVAGKPPAIPSELRPVPASCKLDPSPINSPFSGEEKHMTEKTLLMIKKAFSESGSDLQRLIVCSQSSLDSEETQKGTMTATRVGMDSDISTAILQITGLSDHCIKEVHLKSCISHQEEDSTSNLKDNGSSANVNTGPEMQKCEGDKRSDYMVLMRDTEKLPSTASVLEYSEKQCEDKMIKEAYLPKAEVFNDVDQGLTMCTAERNGEVSSVSSLEQSIETGQNLESKGPYPEELCPVTSVSSDTQPSVISRPVRVSDHIQRFNKLSLNDPGSKKVKSPILFERTPVRQSVRRINSLSEMKKQTSSSTLVKCATMVAPLHKSTSLDRNFFSRVEELAKNSAPPKPTPVVLRVRQTPSSVVKRSAVLLEESNTQVSSLSRTDILLRNRQVTDQKSATNQSKSVLEDVTNHDTSKVVRRDTLEKRTRACTAVTATPDIGLARKLSGKEKGRYRGSPKNPIAKAQLLPTSRPLEL